MFAVPVLNGLDSTPHHTPLTLIFQSPKFVPFGNVVLQYNRLVEVTPRSSDHGYDARSRFPAKPLASHRNLYNNLFFTTVRRSAVRTAFRQTMESDQFPGMSFSTSKLLQVTKIWTCDSA